MIGERQIKDAEITSNKFLAGLVARYGTERLEAVGRAALGYPVALVGTFAEAEQIQQALDRS